ncbi:O-antigen ligase family protein [uncultured Williamsia sp.]|uniref:O-antigen ligase family protein n=1 Tax=uncultured Williamsia sp. TaxID=259311 RepID=UPI002606B5D4|nr:O-antigen ligase family protein [uncultured Williamsia sp.]
MTASDLRSRSPDDSFLRAPVVTPRANPLVIAFAFLLFALPYEAVLPGPLKGNGSPARFIGLMMLALSILALVGGRRFLPSRTASVAGVGCIIGYGALSLFSYARAYSDYFVSANESALATRAVMGVLIAVGVVSYVTLTTTTARARRTVIWALVSGAMVSVVIGLIQGVSTSDYRYILVPPGFSIILEKETTVREGFTRVMGTAGHPIGFSLTVAVILPLAAHLARYSRSRNQRVIAAIFTGLLLIAVPASVSRTAIVAVATSLVIYALVLPIRAMITAFLVLATAVSVYAVVAPELFDAVTKLFSNTGSDDSITGRTDDYAYVGDLFRANPWLGYGFGNSATTERYLDNQWLQAILSGGVMGVVALLLIVVGAVFGVAHSVRHTRRGSEHRDLVFALAGGLAAMVVGFSTFDEFTFSQSFLTLFVLYALVWTFPSTGSAGLIVHKDSPHIYSSEPTAPGGLHAFNG